MKIKSIVISLAALSFMGFPSHAADYSKVIESCKAQIEQEFSPNLERQSFQNARTKGAKKMILGFKVWLSDDADQTAKKVSCTAMKTGEVLELRTL